MSNHFQTVTEGRKKYYRFLGLVTYRERMIRNALWYFPMMLAAFWLLFSAFQFTFRPPYDFPAFWQGVIILLFWPAGLWALFFNLAGLVYTRISRDLIYADQYEPIKEFTFVADAADSFAHFEMNNEGRNIHMPAAFLLSVSDKDGYYFLKYDGVGLTSLESRKNFDRQKINIFLYKWFLYGTIGVDADFLMLKKEEVEVDTPFYQFLQNYL